jgi:hypothetical protein
MVMDDHVSTDPIEVFCETLGFPEWFGRLYNLVYESLAENVGNKWVVELMEAIPVGSDLDELKPPLYTGLLADEEIGIRSECVRSERLRGILDDLLESLVGSHDLRGREELHSRLKQEYDHVRTHFDRFALFSAEWIICDDPTAAVLRAASARVGRLSRTAVRSHRRRHGYDGLVPAGGGNRYALRSAREEQYQRVADFLVKEASRIGAFAVGAASVETIANHRSELRRIPEPGEDPVEWRYRLWPDPPEHVGDPLTPNECSRRWRHPAMKAGGPVACYLGWVMIALGYGAFCTAVDLNNPRATHFEWLPAQIGALILLSVAGTQVVNCGRRISRGDGWYKVLRHPDRLILFLRMFGDDRRRIYPRLLRWFVPRLSTEQQVVEALQVLGEVVQMGDPHDSPIDRAGSRIYVDKDWRRMVSWLMRRARMTVIMFGYADGVRTEMQWARQLLRPEQVLLHIPRHRWRDLVNFAHGNARTNESSLLFDDALQQMLGSDMRIAYKANLEERPSFLWFHPGWRVQPLHPLDDYRLNKIRIYQEALRPVYRKVGVSPKRNLGGPVLLGCLVCGTILTADLLLVKWLGKPLLTQALGSIAIFAMVYRRVIWDRNVFNTHYSEVDYSRFLP